MDQQTVNETFELIVLNVCRHTYCFKSITEHTVGEFEAHGNLPLTQEKLRLLFGLKK